MSWSFLLKLSLTVAVFLLAFVLYGYLTVASSACLIIFACSGDGCNQPWTCDVFGSVIPSLGIPLVVAILFYIKYPFQKKVKKD